MNTTLPSMRPPHRPARIHWSLERAAHCAGRLALTTRSRPHHRHYHVCELARTGAGGRFELPYGAGRTALDLPRCTPDRVSDRAARQNTAVSRIVAYPE